MLHEYETKVTNARGDCQYPRYTLFHELSSRSGVHIDADTGMRMGERSARLAGESRSVTRDYTKKQRAASEEATRLRIVEATIELHQERGADGTTISAIARRANVGRVTVYRHFPDELALLGACTGLYLDRNPVPDLSQWLAEADPTARLERGLRETYAYHRRTERMMAVAERDVATNPVLATLLEPMDEYWRQARDILAAGWGEAASSPGEVVATIALALALSTWKLLTDGQGLSDEQCVRLFTQSVQAQLSSVPRDAAPSLEA